MAQSVGEIKAKLTIDTQQFNQGMKQAKKDLDESSAKARKTAESFQSIKRAAFAVGSAVISGVGASVMVAANFEQSMSRVQAVSGATAEEMMRLEETARELGESTEFSASNAADGMAFLAQAGYSVNEIIEAMPGVLNAASAGQLDLARSADIVSNILSGFGMEAAETNRVVDVLTETMRTANVDIPMLGQSFKMVGPVAQSLGLSIEETAAALGRLGDAGLQGSQAGTILRAALLSLANPVGQTAEVMEELNIEVTDSEGAMKPLPELIGHIAARMEGLTEAQRTQVAAQLAGREAASGFLALLEVGEEELAGYTKQLENSAGAAEEVAGIQRDTLQGAFKEFQSALEELGIAVGQEFLPKFRDIVGVATDLVRWFSDLDASTVALGMKMAGASSSIALVATILARLRTVIGGLMVSLGPAGWLIAGLSALGGAAVFAYERQRELSTVNFELADSLTEQADSLEESVERFEDLKRESGLTKDELSRLIDITKELQDEQDPEKVEALQKEYDKLAEKSGLSNEKLDEMLGLNDKIIEQSPQVEQSFTDKGNAIVDSTDAVKDYIQSLKDMALEELRIERAVALENEAELRQKIKEDTQELHDLESEINRLLDLQKIPLEEARERYYDIDQILTNGNLSIHERNELIDEQSELHDRINGKLADELVTLNEQRQEVLERIENNKSQLDQLDQIDQRISEIYLSELGINEAGEEGIRIAQEQLDRLKDERDELQKIIDQHGDRSGALTDERTLLDRQIEQHESILRKIRQETDYMGEQEGNTSKVNTALDRMYELKKNITESQRNTNREIDRGTEKARDMTSVLSEDVTKEVDIDDKGGVDDLNRRARSPVTKVIRLTATAVGGWVSSLFNRHQGGTLHDAPHPPKLHDGGMGDDALRQLERQIQNYTPPMYNEVDVRLLRNEMVLTEAQQAELFRILDTPSYGQHEPIVLADEEMKAILRSIENKTGDSPIILEIDGRQFASATHRYMTEEQERERQRLQRFKV